MGLNRDHDVHSDDVAPSASSFVASIRGHEGTRGVLAYEAMYECVRDEETNRDMHALKLHEITPADFLENSTPTSSPIDKALAEMYRHARPHTRPLIQNDHHDERS